MTMPSHMSMAGHPMAGSWIPSTRRLGRLMAVLGALCLALHIGPATAQDKPPPFVYLILDTSRPPAVKVSDRSIINNIIKKIRADAPRALFFYHITNHKRASSEIFLDNGSSPQLMGAALETYAKEALPDTLRENRTMAQELRIVASNMTQFGQRIPANAPRWLIAFHDFDWVDAPRSVSSACTSSGGCKALGDGWLTAAKSPIMRDFLSQDTSSMDGMQSMVFLSQTPPLSIRRKKEGFVGRLIEKVGGKLYFLGPTYPSAGGSPLVINYVDSLAKGTLTPLPVVPVRAVDLLQMIDASGKAVTISAYQ